MNSGFFTSEETEIQRGDEKRFRKGEGSIKTCRECGLNESCSSPHMRSSGKGKLEILFVGEAPGETEDKKNTQFVGKSGQLLREVLEELGYDLDRDFWKTNAVICRPPKNDTPKPDQISACRKYLMEDIEKYKPKVIIPLGKTAMDGLVGHRLFGRISSVTMTDWQGCKIPDQVLKCWICPTWHPSYVLREEGAVIRKIFKNDLKRAIEQAKVPMYVHNPESEIFIIRKESEAILLLKKWKKEKKKKHMAFDYETTGLKPYREGHEIVSVSLSDGLFTYSFPFFNDPEFRQEWKEIMDDKDIKKIAHNIKFEKQWTRKRSGYNHSESIWLKGSSWDTMIAAHALDNRKKCNLKFCVYTEMGFLGYDDSIDYYLHAIAEEEERYGANAFNRVKEAPLDDLLLYGGMDSYFTYKLREIQLQNIEPFQENGIKLFLDSSESFAHSECFGIPYDLNQSIELEQSLESKLIRLEKKIQNLPDMKKWDREKLFRPSAPQDLSHLLFDCLKYEAKVETKTGKAKADKDSLEEYDLDIVKNTLEWRKWKKAKDTYLKGFTREAVLDILSVAFYDKPIHLIHPFFNTATVNTFRTSSDSPNFQNVPVRDKNVAILLRMLLKPIDGCRLIECDYKAIEVCILACYNKDPKLISYIQDPSSDLHRDMASEIFVKPKGDVTKEERYWSKNGFVFPTFYGSYWKNTAPNIWAEATKNSIDTIQNLKRQGIRNVSDFTYHIQEIEEKFWGEKFPTAYEWMNKAIKDYEKKGYVDLYTGFRCWAPMTRNQIINYRVQGSACHCLVWTYNQMDSLIVKNEMKSSLIGQIHDSSLGNIYPEEEEEYDQLMWKYGTQKIREHWDWIIVPLSIEKKRSKIDGSWAEMEECGLLRG